MRANYVEKTITWDASTPLSLDEGTMGFSPKHYAMRIVLTGLDNASVIKLKTDAHELASVTGAATNRIDTIADRSTAPYSALTLVQSVADSGDVEVIITGIRKL